MSNGFKLVPVKPTEEMKAEGCMSCQYVSDWDVELIYEAMLAAAPQPPALGGESEVLAIVTLGGYFSSEELGDIDIEPQMSSLERIQQEIVRSDSDEHIELIDRAHLAPLQAEIERWKAISAVQKDRMDVAIDLAKGLREERDQLKARCDELEAGLRIIATAGTKTRAPDLRLKAKQTLNRALSRPAGSEQV